jgi:hypothetical protein
MYYLQFMFVEFAVCLTLESDPKEGAEDHIRQVCSDRFEESERERKEREEYERIFRLLLKEAQSQP